MTGKGEGAEQSVVSGQASPGLRRVERRAGDRPSGETVPPGPRSRALFPRVGHWLGAGAAGIGDITLQVPGRHGGLRWGPPHGGAGTRQQCVRA